MLHISGPVSVSIFHLQDDRKILLFGDVHESKTGLCRPINKKNVDKMFITEFIDSFESTPTDVFLESDWVLDTEKDKVSVQNDVDILRIVLNHYKDKMYTTHDNKKTFRVHYTDIRSVNSYLMLFLSIQAILASRIEQYKNIFDQHPVQVITQYFPTLKVFNKFADTIVKSNNYKRDMHKLLKDDSVFAGSNVLASASGQTERKIHRIRKQLLKLTSKDRNKLMAYHRETIHELYKEFKDTYNDIMKKIKTGKALQNDTTEIASILLMYVSHLMDMYALARMMYYIRNTNSQTFISYAGAAHTLNYTRFFYDFWQNEAKLVHYKDLQLYKNGHVKRCVSIPKEVL